MTLAHLRTEYTLSCLLEEEAGPDPLALFERWLAQARSAGLRDANAMTLASVDGQGQPSLRVVLLKDVGEAGFDWYTNYESRKGRELAAQPRAALQFYWAALERQVSVEGPVVRLGADAADRYFAQRPLGSRIGALASQQSAPVADRAALEARYAAAAAAAGDDPARPAHWGGLRLLPQRLEFWQGRASRLHDRLLYQREAGGHWLRTRLQP
ncbi:MAG: pyridoxamine 5'-phosphate oxidase [Pseudomonadota bacterium]